MYKIGLCGTLRSCCRKNVVLRAVLHAVLHAELLERELVGGTSATAVVQEMMVAETLFGVVQVQG